MEAVEDGMFEVSARSVQSGHYAGRRLRSHCIEIQAIVDPEGSQHFADMFTSRGFIERHANVIIVDDPHVDAVLERSITEVMTANPSTITLDRLAAEALALMRKREFDNLPVVDADGRSVGIIDIQDLPRFKIM